MCVVVVYLSNAAVELGANGGHFALFFYLFLHLSLSSAGGARQRSDGVDTDKLLGASRSWDVTRLGSLRRCLKFDGSPLN